MTPSIWIRALVLSASLSTLTTACVKSTPQSQPNDIKLGELVIDDAFVSQSTSTIIAGALSKGCDDFQFDTATRTRCASAFLRLTELLGFKAATSGAESAFVFLHPELLQIINSPTGKNFLTALSQKISETYSTQKPFALWDFTLSHFKGDTKAAIRHLATLFQDTEPTNAQVRWLLQTGEGDASQLQGLLMDLDYLGKKKLIQYFPASVESSREALYHFYIPMYFASQLKFHYTKKDMAFLTSFLFNARYEFRQIWETSHPQDKVNHDVAGGLARRKALVEDLIAHLKGPIAPFNPELEKGNFEDLYLGYAGAIMGLSGEFTKADSDAFRKSFAQDPLEFIIRRFKTIETL
jgi:hypothetical protein